MKSSLLTLMLLVGLVPLGAQLITQSANLPASGRFGSVAFVIDSVAYTGLGESGNEQYPKQFFKYVPATDTWTEIAPFPGSGREHAVAFTVDGIGYVGLGFSFAGVDFTYHKDFYRYDPETDSWSPVADFGGQARVKAVAFALDSIAYAGTGSNSGEMLNDFWKYDFLTDTWLQVNTLSTTNPMHGASVSVVREKAYLIGGRGNAGAFFEDILEFDPVVGENWVVRKTIPGLTLESGGAFTLDHQIYFGYGGNATSLSSFDPETNTVTHFGQLPDLKSIDRGPVAFAIDSTTAFFGLGYTSVIANQPAAYRNQFWRLEMEVISSVSQPRYLSNAKISRTSNGLYQVVGSDNGPFILDVFALSGIQVAAFPSILPSEQFSIQAPTGMYVFNLRSEAGAVRTELMFNKSE